MNTRHLLFATTAIMIAMPATAQAAADVRHSIDLPAGSLDTALFQVARQTGMQLVFTDPGIAGIRVARVSGSYTARQLLDTLLSKTGYTYRFTGARSVRVIALAKAGAKVRPAALTQSAPQATDGQAGSDTSSTTQAENAVDGNDQQEQGDIVVVGTQIKGSKVTEALPVTVVDEQQIRATGAVSGDELFRSIPQMGDVSFNSSYLPNSSNSARGDVGSVNLRNLGVGNTLTLLNGRRVVAHPTSRADDNLVPVQTYNTNAIPVFGLERLEVLRDGAAAIYGSDAVAGVVNTVLKTNFTGVQIEGQTGWAEGTNLAESNLNLLAGKNLGDRGNITLFASYDRRTSLGARDQDYTASANLNPLFADTRFSTATDGRSTITPWGSFQTLGNVVVRQGATNLTNASGQFHVQPLTNAGCATNTTTGLPGGICIDDGANSAAGDRNLGFDAPHAFNTSVIPSLKRANFPDRPL